MSLSVKWGFLQVSKIGSKVNFFQFFYFYTFTPIIVNVVSTTTEVVAKLTDNITVVGAIF